jgi:hypothetical protein
VIQFSIGILNPVPATVSWRGKITRLEISTFEAVAASAAFTQCVNVCVSIEELSHVALAAVPMRLRGNETPNKSTGLHLLHEREHYRQA